METIPFFLLTIWQDLGLSTQVNEEVHLSSLALTLSLLFCRMRFHPKTFDVELGKSFKCYFGGRIPFVVGVLALLTVFPSEFLCGQRSDAKNERCLNELNSSILS